MSSLVTNLKQRFDDSRYGELYRYTKGWVEFGNPAQAYTQLIYLLQGFTDLCNQYDIEYWLDWGSLLGYLRHKGGLIPWDYDHDVAMRTEEYERFINIVEKLIADDEDTKKSTNSSASSEKSPNQNCTFVVSDFIFERKGERGYYVMSLKSHPDIQIDIVEYITVNDASTRGEDVLKHNMDDVTYEGFFYPDYPVDMIFPLRRVNMCGCSTLIPNDPAAVTALHFGSNYMDVLWVPYILTKLYNPFLTSTLWQPPVRQIPILASYIEGFAKYGGTSPFLVRDPETFRHITIESIFQFVASCKQTVYGYDKDGEMIENLPIRQVVQDWAEDRLNIKVLDSPIKCCQLPEDFLAIDVEPPSAASEKRDSSKPASNSSATSASSDRLSDAGLGLMVTAANSYTFLHTDPPFYGGGWMYLASGRKSWTYISPDFIDLLYDPSTRRLLDLPISELTTRFGYQ